jgi:hypothetical protein
MLPDFDCADRIGEFYGNPKTRAFGELLIDLEEDKAARAVVFGLLAEMDRKVASPLAFAPRSSASFNQDCRVRLARCTDGGHQTARAASWTSVPNSPCASSLRR